MNIDTIKFKKVKLSADIALPSAISESVEDRIGKTESYDVISVNEINGKFIQYNDGKIYDNKNLSYLKIDVAAGEKYKIQTALGGTAGICMYDKDNQLIEEGYHISQTDATMVYLDMTIPEGCVKLGISNYSVTVPCEIRKLTSHAVENISKDIFEISSYSTSEISAIKDAFYVNDYYELLSGYTTTTNKYIDKTTGAIQSYSSDTFAYSTISANEGEVLKVFTALYRNAGIGYYDAIGNCISAFSFVSGSDVQISTVVLTMPEHCKSVKITNALNNKFNSTPPITMTVHKLKSGYEPTAALIYQTPVQMADLCSYVKESISSPKQINGNPISGYYINNKGAITEYKVLTDGNYSSYSTASCIAGETYLLNGNIQQSLNVCFYSSNGIATASKISAYSGQALAKERLNDGTGTFVYFPGKTDAYLMKKMPLVAPAEAKTIAVCSLRGQDYPPEIFDKYGSRIDAQSIDKKFSDFEYEFDELKKEVLNRTDVLNSKKYLAIGDSWTCRVQGSVGTSYPEYIATRNNMGLSNIAVSGTNIKSFALSCTNDEYKSTVSSYVETAEYITIAYGLNDNDTTVGTINDSTTDTLYGSWNVTLSALLDWNPKAKIGVIIQNGWMQKTSYDMIVAIAKWWGLPYLDLKDNENMTVMDGDRLTNPINPYALQKRMSVFVDNPSSVKWHPVNAGNKFKSTIVENFMRSI